MQACLGTFSSWRSRSVSCSLSASISRSLDSPNSFALAISASTSATCTRACTFECARVCVSAHLHACAHTHGAHRRVARTLALGSLVSLASRVACMRNPCVRTCARAHAHMGAPCAYVCMTYVCTQTRARMHAHSVFCLFRRRRFVACLLLHDCHRSGWRGGGSSGSGGTKLGDRTLPTHVCRPHTQARHGTARSNVAWHCTAHTSTCTHEPTSRVWTCDDSRSS